MNANLLLTNVTPGWRNVLTATPEMTAELERVATVLAGERAYFPPAAQIFEFARHSFTGIHAVIIGMDPYPAAGTGARSGIQYTRERMSGELTPDMGCPTA